MKHWQTLAEFEKDAYSTVRDWDWKAVVKEAYPIEDEEGNPIWSFSLGDISYSGKFYLPFACSNVEACPECNGSGFLGWGMGFRAMMSLATDGVCYVNQYTCPVCDGLGSMEAARDEVMFDVVEEVASEHGMWLHSDCMDHFLQWERGVEEGDDEDE